jgi:hypothetical protein
MIRLMLTAVALAVSGAAIAKLPPLDEAAKAKAAETAAKSAWQGKMDAYLLCKAQDRVVALYKRTAASRPAVAVPAGTTTTVATAPAAGAAPATAAPPAPAAKPPVPTTTTASQGGSTPVPNVATAAAPPVTPCADPGPFAYAPPAQKPLETSGAHSPAPTAASPPSVRPHSAEMAPAKPGTAQSKKP